jgi:hypothetical protein
VSSVSAPTLWEEGRWSATRVTRFSAFVCALLVAADLALTGRLGVVFDSGFVIVCVAIALAVRPEDFFRVGVLPPMLLLGISGVLALGHRAAIAASGDGLVQALISGLAHHSGALLAGYGLCLVILAIRQRVVSRSAEAHANREESPAPYRVISGAPEVRSTTVVGSEPHSPSRTASNS